MTVSSPSSSSPSPAPDSSGAPAPRPRPGGGRHHGQQVHPSGSVPAPRTASGRHRAGTQAPEVGASEVGVPFGAVPTQREPVAARRRPSPGPRAALPADEAATVPVRRSALDEAVARVPARSAGEGIGPEAPTRPAVSRRPAVPWEPPRADRASWRLGRVAIVIGVLGVLVGLAPWSGLLPRVLPGAALGATPVFGLAGALLGVAALGVGAVAMFRAPGASRGLLAGVLGACTAAAAIVVGLVV